MPTLSSFRKKISVSYDERQRFERCSVIFGREFSIRIHSLLAFGRLFPLIWFFLNSIRIRGLYVLALEDWFHRLVRQKHHDLLNPRSHPNVLQSLAWQSRSLLGR